MKRFVFGCLFGTLTTLAGVKVYSKFRTENDLQKGDQQTVNAFIDHHKLKTMLKLKIMSSYAQFTKSFLDYGLRERLQGFYIYDIYFQQAQLNSPSITKSYCIFSPKETLCGHPNIQHGGATATIADQNSGFLAMLYSKQIVATAELQIKYLKPVKKGQVYVWSGKVSKRDERKIFINSQIIELQTGVKCAQCQVLMMTVNWQHRMGQVFNLLFKKSQNENDSKQ